MSKRKEFHWSWLVTAVLALGLLLFASAASHAASEPKKIRVGALIALTGWFSVAGAVDIDECRTVVDMVNAHGGVTIKGVKYVLELVPEDTKSTNEGAVAALNKLIYDKHVQFVVGPPAFWGPATAPLCEASKMINLLGWNSNTPGELDKNTQYRILAEDGSMGHLYALIKYIKKNHPEIKSVVITNPDDGGIPYQKPLVAKALQDAGISVVGDWVSFPNELVDFTPIASKIAARKADAVIHPNGIGPNVAPILKGLRELGDNRWYFHAGVTTCADLKTLAGVGGRKVVTLAATPGAPGNPPQMEEFIKTYGAKLKAGRSLIFQSSSAVYVLPQILQAAQSLDSTEIKKTLPRIQTVATLMGPGHFGGEKTYGVKNAVVHPLPSQYIDDKGNIKSGGWINDVVVP